MARAALFTTGGSNSSIHRWENRDKQMWSVHTTEYDSAIKRKEALLDPWYNMDGLENIMLSAGSQSWKTAHCMIPFT